jgi:hypothetical protein
VSKHLFSAYATYNSEEIRGKERMLEERKEASRKVQGVEKDVE